jgi:hypothetical protein
MVFVFYQIIKIVKVLEINKKWNADFYDGYDKIGFF